ncbi:hypothetical protein DNH61_03240 [Paenibacillus sambharensis]|uniref:Uncharacterized protein n=1 Tax=Paenibacillus sambharensis TaxID=1803190 RepID=A0A2W1LRA8_9BACL|nr:hypothetical protein [Paenibacillus sambharensis]PZD97375.1 hypothetical protein DNH61_03240 [Paenibacillus sambharensis]
MILWTHKLRKHTIIVFTFLLVFSLLPLSFNDKPANLTETRLSADESVLSAAVWKTTLSAKISKYSPVQLPHVRIASLLTFALVSSIYRRKLFIPLRLKQLLLYPLKYTSTFVAVSPYTRMPE